MVPYATYQSDAGEIPFMRKWLLRALVISLLLHAGLLIFFNFKKLENFGDNARARLAPTPRIIRNFHLSDLSAQDRQPVIPDNQPVSKPMVIPTEPPTVDEINLAPRVPQDLPAPTVLEKQKPDSSAFEALANNSVNSLATRIDMGIDSSSQPIIQVPVGDWLGDAGFDSSGGIPGRTSLNEALAMTGGLAGNKIVAMHGGALFGWGKADLLPEAIEDLQKLGLLIQRNPNATIMVSGHTDHTGTHDANLVLSQQRADAVRDWLVANLGIDPLRITTIGKADDEAFPELGPDKSIEEQAPNRRVEIVLKTHRK